jgi:glycosyltransferase involved in cell wall biosynthesis
MAAALVELLLNPNELQRRAVLALKRADDFSWDKAAEETIRVYHLVNRLISTQ